MSKMNDEIKGSNMGESLQIQLELKFQDFRKVKNITRLRDYKNKLLVLGQLDRV